MVLAFERSLEGCLHRGRIVDFGVAFLRLLGLLLGLAGGVVIEQVEYLLIFLKQLHPSIATSYIL